MVFQFNKLLIISWYFRLRFVHLVQSLHVNHMLIIIYSDCVFEVISFNLPICCVQPVYPFNTKLKNINDLQLRLDAGDCIISSRLSSGHSVYRCQVSGCCSASCCFQPYCWYCQVVAAGSGGHNNQAVPVLDCSTANKAPSHLLK